MESIEYASFVSSRAKLMANRTEDFLHAAIGIAGEAGELLDAVKKTWVYNKPIDEVNIVEELGDILFYVQMMCNTLRIDMDLLLKTNMVKLTARYPTGYSDAAAQARADKPGTKLL